MPLIIKAHESNVGIANGHNPGPAAQYQGPEGFRSFHDKMLAPALRDLAQGADHLAGAMYQRQMEKQQLDLVNDVANERDAMQRWLDTERQNNQGAAAVGMEERFIAYNKERADALKQKYPGVKAQTYLAQQISPLALAGTNAARDHEIQQLGVYKEQTYQGVQSQLLTQMASSPADYQRYTGAMVKNFTAMNKDAAPEWLAANADKLRAEGTKQAFTAALSQGDFDTARRIRDEAYQAGAAIVSGGLGGLSAKHESSAAGSRAIGYDTKGGTSYGTYQIAAKPGTFKGWLNWLTANGHEDVAAELSAGPADTGGRGGTVPQAWKKMVAEGRITHEMEHEFIKATHYDPAVNGLNAELRQMVEASPAIQDVVWSTAVQHGAAGGKNILNSAYKEGMTSEEFVEAVYSGRTANFKNNPYATQAANRFKDESREAVAMLRSEQAGSGQEQKDQPKPVMLASLGGVQPGMGAPSSDDDGDKPIGAESAPSPPAQEGEKSGQAAQPQSAMKRGNLFAEADIAGMDEALNKSLDDHFIKNTTGGIANAFQNGTEVEIASSISQAFNEIKKIDDPDRRNNLMKSLQQNIDFEQKARNADDMEGKEKFIALAEQEKWSPMEKEKRLDDAQSLSRGAKDKMRDELRKGTFNKPTPENRAALAQGRAFVDDGGLTNQGDIEAFAYENNLTTTHTQELIKYLDNGGQVEMLSKAQSTINRLYKAKTGGKKDPPPELFEMVAEQLEPGKKPTHEVLSKIIANLVMDGEYTGGWTPWDPNEKYMTALSKGRAETWLPDVPADAEAEIKQRLVDLGLNPSGAAIREYYKYNADYMGLPRETK